MKQLTGAAVCLAGRARESGRSRCWPEPENSPREQPSSGRRAIAKRSCGTEEARCASRHRWTGTLQIWLWNNDDIGAALDEGHGAEIRNLRAGAVEKCQTSAANPCKVNRAAFTTLPAEENSSGNWK